MAERALIRLRNLYLAGLYFLAAVQGLRIALLPAGIRTSDAMMQLLTGGLLAMLVVADARVLSRRLPHVVGFVVFFLWPVAAPACVIALRKWRGVGWVLLHTALLVLLRAAFAYGMEGLS